LPAMMRSQAVVASSTTTLHRSEAPDAGHRSEARVPVKVERERLLERWAKTKIEAALFAA